MTQAVFDCLLASVSALYQGSEALQAFVPWQQRLDWQPREPVHIPAADLVGNWLDAGTPETMPLHNAVAQAARHVDWRQTYTEDEVGAHFLANYGYFELFGPDGHFRTPEARAYIAYWGPKLYYDWHCHEAEELYVVLSGEALFHIDGGPDLLLRPGDTRLHGSWQSHAMTTLEQPILTLVLWRGAGLEGLPEMGRAA